MGGKSKRTRRPKRKPSTIRGFFAGVAATLLLVSAAWWALTPEETRTRQVAQVFETFRTAESWVRDGIDSPEPESPTPAPEAPLPSDPDPVIVDVLEP